MNIDYHVTGPDRKRLVEAISAYTGERAKYLGMPSTAYEVGQFTIDKTGMVSYTDRDGVDGLIEVLADQGFVTEVADLGPDVENDDPFGLTISLPLDNFDPASLDRLQRLVDSKATLIRKALCADRLSIRIADDAVRFPWWDATPEPDEAQAYAAFIAALGAMAREAKRVTATERDVESEKFSFRCFLLRLGFIGDESKKQRKVLLRQLSGSAAFPNQTAADEFAAAQRAKRTKAG